MEMEAASMTTGGIYSVKRNLYGDMYSVKSSVVKMLPATTILAEARSGREDTVWFSDIRRLYLSLASTRILRSFSLI